MIQKTKPFQSWPDPMSEEQTRARLYLEVIKLSIEMCNNDRDARQTVLEFLKQYPNFVDKNKHQSMLN